MAQISGVFKPSFSYSNMSRNQVAPLIQTLIFWLSLQDKVIQCFEGYYSNKSTSKHCILRNCLSGSYENWSYSGTIFIFFLFQMLLLHLIHRTPLLLLVCMGATRIELSYHRIWGCLCLQWRVHVLKEWWEMYHIRLSQERIDRNRRTLRNPS